MFVLIETQLLYFLISINLKSNYVSNYYNIFDMQNNLINYSIKIEKFENVIIKSTS
jgi:hypothetical protein